MLSPGAYGHGGGLGTQGWIDPTQDLFMILLIQRGNQSNAEETKMRHDFQAAVVAGAKK
jgi:CubicO group peptidase (beta-lactamase class C family)